MIDAFRLAFVGLTTLDVIYAVDHVPAPNEKLLATHYTVSAGGPATNAAVTAAWLGADVQLVAGIGQHPLTAGIHEDLRRCGVEVLDATPFDPAPPPLSTVLVTSSTGERAVISRNAVGRELAASEGLASQFSGVRGLLTDGHQPDLALTALKVVRGEGGLTMLDAGSWKEAVPSLLPHLDVVIASANFAIPGVLRQDRLDYLLDQGVAFVAETDGGNPIVWKTETACGEVGVPRVNVVDTLGSGDVFHGAALYGLAACADLNENCFVEVLTSAAEIAARSCTFFGTRTWLAGHPSTLLKRYGGTAIPRYRNPAVLQPRSPLDRR